MKHYFSVYLFLHRGIDKQAVTWCFPDGIRNAWADKIPTDAIWAKPENVSPDPLTGLWKMVGCRKEELSKHKHCSF